MDTTVTDPMVGRLLDGRYRVEERIARGGMATVYRAVDTRLDRQVALKIMLPTFAEDPQFVSRFNREARAVARISDAHVVSVFDQGEDDGVVFLAMEYIPGRTLRELLNARTRLNPRETVNVITPVLQALTVAHRSGLVHRDVKPENVLIGDDGRVRVADFGLARPASASASDHATRGVLMGTVAYLAPEQVSPGVSDERSDVYAVGIMMFELLTGKPPFDGDDAIVVAYQHVHEDVPAPSSKADDVPPALDAIVVSATQRDPAQRPANAAALLAMVENLPSLAEPSDHRPTVVVPLPGGPITATRHTAVTALPGQVSPSGTEADVEESPIRRKKGRGLIALLLVLALAAAAGGFAWWLGNPSNATVPGVTGLAKQAAEAKLTEAGLEFDYAHAKFSETVDKGEVISSDPEQGASIADGGTVTLTLSKGPERYEVPSLVGLPFDVALKKLDERHLAKGDVERVYSETMAEGKVISSAPQKGAELKRDTQVDLKVSKGPPPIPVPNVVGKDVDTARATLEDRGLSLHVADSRYNKETPEGSIISQDPDEGASFFGGGTVSVVVSLGPPLVEVPNVVDAPLDDARATLEAAGFNVSTYEIVGYTPLDRVATQNPDGGTKAPWGSTVRLGIF